MLRRFSGATVRRTIDRSHALVREHAHDWPMLSIFVMGDYANRTEMGEKVFDGPSAVLYRAKAAHRNVIGAVGFEQLEIEFDPHWLGRSVLPSAPVTRWTGGLAAAEAKKLATFCVSEISEEHLRSFVRRFVESARARPDLEQPKWLHAIKRRLRAKVIPSVADLAEEIGLHPSYVGSAYRKACGGRLQETVARIRVERAARQLRETDTSFAFAALEAGFCDQSHMNRSFGRVLGRPPSAVRRDSLYFRQDSP